MARSDGKSRDAEMRRNDTYRNPAGTGDKRFQPSDASGNSSSRSRAPGSHAERAESASSGRGGANTPSGTSSHDAAHRVPHGGATQHGREPGAPAGPNTQHADTPNPDTHDRAGPASADGAH